MDELELLKDQNRELVRLCQIMSDLLSGMMDAMMQDNPAIAAMPHVVEGQKMFADWSLRFREIKGEA